MFYMIYIAYILPCAGQLNLSCGSGNLGKIWSICRWHEIQYRE